MDRYEPSATLGRARSWVDLATPPTYIPRALRALDVARQNMTGFFSNPGVWAGAEVSKCLLLYTSRRLFGGRMAVQAPAPRPVRIRRCIQRDENRMQQTVHRDRHTRLFAESSSGRRT